MHKEIIIIKIGSHLATQASIQSKIAHEIAQLKDQYHFIIVCSGAIATAKNQNTAYTQLDNNLATKQVLASVGQIQLIQEWKQMFLKQNLDVGQILITKNDLTGNGNENLRNLITKSHELNIIPILNENDAIATDEIKYGDNDFLSAHIAQFIQASHFIILTSSDGVYKTNPQGQKTTIPHIKKATFDLQSFIETEVEDSTEHGSGSIVSKMEAGFMACEKNILSFIAHGQTPDILNHILKPAEAQISTPHFTQISL